MPQGPWVTDGRTRDMKGVTAAMVAFLVLALGSTAGCYRSPTDVTVYDPGVYKGAPDPLVAASKNPEHEQALRERFTMAATDR
jgi:hypothetical protein